MEQNFGLSSLLCNFLTKTDGMKVKKRKHEEAGEEAGVKCENEIGEGQEKKFLGTSWTFDQGEELRQKTQYKGRMANRVWNWFFYNVKHC